jgi:hypothetical protein
MGRRGIGISLPLAREIFYLRRAVSNPDFPQVSDVTKCKCLNNLGRRRSVAGRAAEALEYWRRTLEVCPNYGMALFNEPEHCTITRHRLKMSMNGSS